MKTAFRLIGFLRGMFGWVILSVLLGGATVASSVALMGTSAYLISAAALHPSIAALEVAIVGVRFFGLARGVLRYLERLASHNANFRLLARLRVWFYRVVEPLAPARLSDYRAGDLLTRAVGDINTLEDFFVRALAPPAAAALVLVGVCWFTVGYAPASALALAVAFLLAGLAAPLLLLVLSRAPARRQVTLRASLNALLTDGILGLADTLAFGAEGQQQARLNDLTAELAALERRQAWIAALSAGLMSLFAHGGAWAVLVLAIPLVAAGRLEGVMLAVLALAAQATFEAAAPLPQSALTFESSLAAGRRLFEIAEAHTAVEIPPVPLPLPPIPHLEVRSLRFRYAPDDPLALDGLDLDLAPGRSVALVGPSGAGKTTLIRLLLRLWDYSEGQIRLGGADLHCLDPEAVRSRFAVVAQNAYIFDATIEENLRLARPGASKDELLQALEAAQLADFVNRLPQGLNTWVGEHGVRLSGGERQRLALARALLQDAPILLLDEPVAHLDALTARAVLETILASASGRSLLLCTHSLMLLERVDEICVLRGGRIVESGDLNSLMVHKGLLYSYFQIQQDQLL